MSRSNDALAALEKAAALVLECADGTLSGVGMACFITSADQANAFIKARAKKAAAEQIVAAIATFKAEHSSFS